MRVLVAFSCLALAACTTPRDACVERADTDYRGLLAAVEIAEENVARGYAINRQVVPVNTFNLCLGTGFGHHTRVGFTGCRSTTYRTVETPVPVDVAEEERKLASMRQLVPGARERRDRAVAACYSQYGDG